MVATMAGSRGGTIGLSCGLDGPRFAERLLTGGVSFSEFSARLAAPARLQNVTLVVNSRCNLHCRHCYLQVKEPTAGALTENEWHRLIDSVAEADPDLICLSGKEVFLGDMGARLLAYAREARDRRGDGGRVGIITNGTLVAPHRASILEARPSYFDISLDGVEEDHDAIRGPGAFAKAIPNIVWASQAFGPDFFVNMTIQKQNVRRLPEAVRLLSDLGVRNLAIGFYKPLPYTDPSLALSEDDVTEFFARLSSLEGIVPKQSLRIMFDFDMIIPIPFQAFLASEWFSFEGLREDSKGELFLESTLNEKLSLETRLAPYPTGVWRSVRLTPEGNYLAAEDTVDTSGYATRSLGNVRDVDFDFSALHERARSSVRFGQIVRSFYDETLPGLVAAVARGARRRAA